MDLLGLDPPVAPRNVVGQARLGLLLSFLAPRIEEQSSQFNFLTQVGLGAQFFMTQRQALTLGIRWHHFSSADIGDRNVGVNSLLAFLGLAFYIPD